MHIDTSLSCDSLLYTTAADIFRLNSRPENAKKDLTISASFFEIYSGKVYDLINKKVRLRILEDAKQQVQVMPVAQGLYSHLLTVINMSVKCDSWLGCTNVVPYVHVSVHQLSLIHI